VIRRGMPEGKQIMSINKSNTDRPIEHSSEDLLGRSDFAKHLARVVENWSGHDSLVIGLAGPWGSGKTSIKNMVRESLPAGVICYEFSPWFWSGKQKLLEIFFDELSKAIGKKNKFKEYKRLAKKLKSYAALLNLGKTTTELIPNAYLLVWLPISAFTDWKHFNRVESLQWQPSSFQLL